MESFEIDITDLERIFFGEVPASFFLEIIFRTAFVYLILIVSMRLMGKRMSSTLQRNELAAMVTLAAAIGVPIQEPARGLLPAAIIALVVIVVQQLVAKRVAKNDKFERLSQGEMMIMVKDNVLNLNAMSHSKISREQLFSELRSRSVKHLGKVKRLYMEANGTFSLIEDTAEQSGLCILPEWDTDYKKRLCTESHTYVCNICGNKKNDSAVNCNNCEHDDWVKAVRLSKSDSLFDIDLIQHP